MALPVWGNLEKSQIDDEKIEEAIARLIQAHEDDPNAHVEEGESLQSHKASEIIDHLVSSIVADKIKDGEVLGRKISDFLFSNFESLDGWDTDGTVNPMWSEVEIQTAAILNDTAKLYPKVFSACPNFQKDPYFETLVRFSNNTNQLVYIVCGSPDLGGNGADSEYFGFKVVDGALYACVTKLGVEYTDVISGITILNQYHKYRAEIKSGEYADFYIDDVLKVHRTANVPNLAQPASGSTIYYYIKTTEAAFKRIHARYILYSQTPLY